MKPYKVNETAEKILDILSRDAKSSAGDIARQLNLAEGDVTRTIKKLEKDRIILGYRANVNWQRIRHNQVRALIEVKVSPERGVGFDHVAELIYRFPEVSSVTLLSGAYDLLVQIEGENLREVAQFVSEKLATIKGVMSTATHFMLKKYKEDGLVLVDQADSKRLPLSL
jgi:DNA-binding Lrp family transcriptional regulator